MSRSEEPNGRKKDNGPSLELVVRRMDVTRTTMRYTLFFHYAGILSFFFFLVGSHRKRRTNFRQSEISFLAWPSPLITKLKGFEKRRKEETKTVSSNSLPDSVYYFLCSCYKFLRLQHLCHLMTTTMDCGMNKSF